MLLDRFDSFILLNQLPSLPPLQILPPIFVTETDDGTVQGFIPLMIVEAVLIGMSLLLALVFFKSAPPTPPSYSTHLRNAGIDIYSSIDSGDEQGGWLRLKKEYNKLMGNKDYVILLISFSLGLGLFNTFLTLIYQIIEPWGYRSVSPPILLSLDPALPHLLTSPFAPLSACCVAVL
jgi:Na+/melibiose symporter-like transporter